MIWYAAWGLIIYMLVNGDLALSRFVGIMFLAALAQAFVNILAKAVSRKRKPETEPSQASEEKIESATEKLWRERYENLLRTTVEQQPRATSSPPDGTANIKLTTMSEIRNLLLMHHNARQADETYGASRIAKQTNDTVAALNVFLTKRKAKTSL